MKGNPRSCWRGSCKRSKTHVRREERVKGKKLNVVFITQFFFTEDNINFESSKSEYSCEGSADIKLATSWNIIEK